MEVRYKTVLSQSTGTALMNLIWTVLFVEEILLYRINTLKEIKSTAKCFKVRSVKQVKIDVRAENYLYF